MRNTPLTSLSASILHSLFFTFLLTACATQPTVSTPKPVNLIPYLTATQAALLSTPDGLVPLKTPLPTSTPFDYIVKSGDTISSIALQFGVTIESLMAANPEISPNAMSIGATLKIPNKPQGLAGEATPTPAPLTVEQIQCYPVSNKGMWCFVLVHNDYSEYLENVSAQVTIVDGNGTFLATQTALLPLNILPPNSSLPLAAYFRPDVPVDAKPQVQILTAIRLSPNETRYLPAMVNNMLVQIDEGGHFAVVSGDVVLPSESKNASQVWVTAVVYDSSGTIVGYKRWEGGGVQPGGSLRFEMNVASLGGVMTRVEFAVEARP